MARRVQRYRPQHSNHAPGGLRRRSQGRQTYTPQAPKAITPRLGNITPATPATPSPFDAGLAAKTAALNARRQTLLSDLGVDLYQTSQEYGFQYNPASGMFGGFDPTNPFSQAALLVKTRQDALTNANRAYDRGVRGTQQNYAQTGQLYSGAYENAQQENNRLITQQRGDIQLSYDKGYDTLRRGFEDYVKRYLRRKRDIQTANPEELASLA